MGIETRPLTSSDDAAVRSFLNGLAETSPSVLAYHDPLYLNLLIRSGMGEAYSIAAFEGNTMIGLLPALIRRAESGSVVSSLPFFGPNAGVLCAKGESADAIHTRLIQGMLERLRDEPHLLSFSLQTPFHSENPERYTRLLPDALVLERFTQYLELSNAVWPAKVRYDIRRTEKLGVEVEMEATPDRLAEMYDIYRENCADAGIAAKPQEIVETLATEGVSAGLADIRFACYEGRMVSALLTLYSPATASYYLPCTRREARHLQAATWLIDQAALRMKALGVRFWNWEGSPSRDSGVYQFKARWGGHESNYQTLVLPFQPPDVFRALGREQIARDFPFYFVYPFHRI